MFGTGKRGTLHSQIPIDSSDLLKSETNEVQRIDYIICVLEYLDLSQLRGIVVLSLKFHGSIIISYLRNSTVILQYQQLILFSNGVTYQLYRT